MSHLRRDVSRLKDVLLVLAAIAVVLAVAGYYSQTQELATFGVAAVQQEIRARFDDCTQLNKIRAGLRSTVQQGKVEDPLLYQLVPSLNTPRVRQIVATNERTELREFAAVSCKDYARRAIPAGDHHHYKVP